MKNTVREPRQERSIEKKNKIIRAGYELFSEVGYYGTNTVEIAKRAGVSTGIVYGYFADKRDILIVALEIYIDKVSAPIIKLMDRVHAPIKINELAEKAVDAVISAHRDNAKMHATLHSLAATDEAVNARFIELESRMTEELSARLTDLGFGGEHMLEKVHFCMNLVQSFAHEYVFDNHDYIDYDVLRSLVCRAMTELFTVKNAKITE